MDLLKVRLGEAALYNDRVVIIKQIELKTMQAWCDYTDTNERALVSFHHLNALRPRVATTSGKRSNVASDLGDIPPEKLVKANKKKQIVLAVEVNANPAVTLKEKKLTVRELAKANGLHRATVYRHIKKYKEGDEGSAAWLIR